MSRKQSANVVVLRRPMRRRAGAQMGLMDGDMDQIPARRWPAEREEEEHPPYYIKRAKETDQQRRDREMAEWHHLRNTPGGDMSTWGSVRRLRLRRRRRPGRDPRGRSGGPGLTIRKRDAARSAWLPSPAVLALCPRRRRGGRRGGSFISRRTDPGGPFLLALWRISAGHVVWAGAAGGGVPTPVGCPRLPSHGVHRIAGMAAEEPAARRRDNRAKVLTVMCGCLGRRGLAARLTTTIRGASRGRTGRASLPAAPVLLVSDDVCDSRKRGAHADMIFITSSNLP